MKISRKAIKVASTVGVIALAVGIGGPVIANSDSAAGTKLGSSDSVYSLSRSNYSGSNIGINAWQVVGSGTTPDAWSGQYDGASESKTWTGRGSDGQNGKTLTKGDGSGDYESVAYLASIAKNYVEKKDYNALNLISIAIKQIDGLSLSDTETALEKANSEKITNIISRAHDQAGPYTTNYTIDGTEGMRTYHYSLSNFNVVTAAGSAFSTIGIEDIVNETDAGQDNTTGPTISVDKGNTESEDASSVKLYETISDFTYSATSTTDTCSTTADGLTVSFNDLPSSSISVSDPVGTETTNASDIASLLQYGNTQTNTMNLSPCSTNGNISLSSVAYAGNDTNKYRQINNDNFDSIENIYSDMKLTGLTDGAEYTLSILVQDASTFEEKGQTSKTITYDANNENYEVSMPAKDILANNSDSLIVYTVVSDSSGRVVAQQTNAEDKNEDILIERTTGVQDMSLSTDVEGSHHIIIGGSKDTTTGWGVFANATFTAGSGLREDNDYYIQFEVIDNEMGTVAAQSDIYQFPYTDQAGTYTTQFNIPKVERFAGKGFRIAVKITDGLGQVAYYDPNNDDSNYTLEFSYEDTPEDTTPKFDPETVKNNANDAYKTFFTSMMSVDGVESKKAVDTYEASSKTDADRDALIATLSPMFSSSVATFPEDQDELAKVLIDLAQGAWFGNATTSSLTLDSSMTTLNDSGDEATIDTTKVGTTFGDKSESIFDADSISLKKDSDGNWKVILADNTYKVGPTPTEPESNDDGDDNGSDNESQSGGTPTTVDDTNRSNNSANGSTTPSKQNSDTRTCSDFSTQEDAQTAYEAGNVSLDTNKTGVACPDLKSANYTEGSAYESPTVSALRKTGAPIAAAFVLGGILFAGGVFMTKRKK